MTWKDNAGGMCIGGKEWRMGATSEVGQRCRDSDLGQKEQLEAASQEAREEQVTSEGFMRAG